MEYSSILIKNGTVVNAHEILKNTDVLIKGEKVFDVSQNIEAPENCKVVDATNKFVFPGFIEPHCHLEMPFMGTESKDDFYTGTCAAVSGGTTMVIDFAMQPKGATFMDAYETYRKKADPKVVCDYGLHIGVTGFSEQEAKDMVKLTSEMKVLNSYKFFLAYKGSLMLEDEKLCKGFELCGKIGAVAQVHAENGELVSLGQQKIFDKGITGPVGHLLSRPPSYEGEATARAILLAHESECPLYVVHVMSKDALEAVIDAKKKGWNVIGEAIAGGITLDDSKVYDEDFDVAARYVMSPPLREKGHQEALRNALKNKLLDLIGTDHCVFNTEQKRMGLGDFRKIPNGMNGIEDRPNLVWTLMVNTGMITPMDYCRILSTKAAKIFNIYGKKGVIQKGADADIAILDPEKEKVISAKTHHQNIDYNVFEGIKVKGLVDTTISRGKVVWENDKLSVQKGSGKYISTPPYPTELYGYKK